VERGLLLAAPIGKQAQGRVHFGQNGLELGALVCTEVIFLQPIKHLLFLNEKSVDRRHRGCPISARPGRCSALSRPCDGCSIVFSEPSLSRAPQRGHLNIISASGRPRELVAAIGQDWQRGQDISIRSAVAMGQIP
jgi:hypothetical protein